eukprot:m.63717 g.63717  ORF g.63717 m.63717 type:complete len:347 (-) comp23329_c0_seq1:192-1232(-)
MAAVQQHGDDAHVPLTLWLCARDYLGGVPFRRFEALQQMSTISSEDFCKKVVQHPVAKIFAPTATHSRSTIKQAIARFEKFGVAVDGELYEMLADLMGTKIEEENWCYKSYCCASASELTNQTLSHRVDSLTTWITLKERQQIISGGTTGLSTWDAALALSEWATLNTAEFDEKSVIELGTGTGLVGISIAKATEAISVILTDVNPSVLEVARENIVINKNRAPAFGATNLNVEKLDWENFDPVKTDFAAAADVIVAADVVYDPSLVPPLVHVLVQLLVIPSEVTGKSKPHAIISLTRRNPETMALFFKTLDEAGLHVEFLQVPTIDLFARTPEAEIKIFKVTHQS